VYTNSRIQLQFISSDHEMLDIRGDILGCVKPLSQGFKHSLGAQAESSRKENLLHPRCPSPVQPVCKQLADNYHTCRIPHTQFTVVCCVLWSGRKSHGVNRLCNKSSVYSQLNGHTDGQTHKKRPPWHRVQYVLLANDFVTDKYYQVALLI